MTLIEQLRYYSQHDGAVFDKPILTKRMIKAADEIERLRAALARFADRSNWYFEGDHMCAEWMGKDFPWDTATAALRDDPAP